MLYMVTFTINIPQMLAYIPYMDPMGYIYINMCENCGKHETYLSHLGRTSVSAGRIIVILSRISSCQAYCYVLVRICLFLESIYSRMYICTGRGPKT